MLDASDAGQRRRTGDGWQSTYGDPNLATLRTILWVSKRGSFKNMAVTPATSSKTAKCTVRVSGCQGKASICRGRQLLQIGDVAPHLGLGFEVPGDDGLLARLGAL